MRCSLTGCCVLAVIHLSVALKVIQRPRFYGMRTGNSVLFSCASSNPDLPANVSWVKVRRYNDDPGSGEEIQAGKRTGIRARNLAGESFLFIQQLQVEDAGVYFCQMNSSWGPGTGLQVARPVDRDKALYRTRMKDGLIVLQGLLLAVCVAAVLLRNRTMSEKKDIIYEEPDTDHIYEGLTIEAIEDDLYEDLSMYAQPEGAEAPWE